MMIHHPPEVEIWVHGAPQSFRKKPKSLSRYTKSIRDAASGVIDEPLKSTRIDVEIIYSAPSINRADVDNIIKPILDALCGVVYVDDVQVRSVKATALPTDQAFSCRGSADHDRLFNEANKQFLIRIYDGLRVRGEI